MSHRRAVDSSETVHHAHHRWEIHANRNCRLSIHEKFQYENESYHSPDNNKIYIQVYCLKTNLLNDDVTGRRYLHCPQTKQKKK